MVYTTDQLNVHLAYGKTRAILGLAYGVLKDAMVGLLISKLFATC